jgi:hypothetical protein
MKVVNVVLAIGTLIILGALITLGIKAFYPEPSYPDYGAAMKPMSYPPEAPCATNDVQCKKAVASYNAKQQAQQDAFQKAQRAYDDQMKVYNRNVFIAANIIGIIVFVAGFFAVLYGGLVGQGVPIGVMMAGLWSIIYGYARGWGSIDDRLKFFVGLVIAILVIGGSAWLMQRRGKRAAL